MYAFKDNQCNVDIPSDRCAKNAHGSLVGSIWLPASGYEADALVMWIPEWHIDPTFRARNNIGAITRAWMTIIDHCRSLTSKRVAATGTDGPTFFKARVFEQMMIRIQGSRWPQVQVGIVGREISALGAESGGLLFQNTDYGTVVLLPTLSRHV